MILKGTKHGRRKKEEKKEEKKVMSKVMSLLRASKNTCFPNSVASKNDSRCIWKAIYTLTNKDASISQVTVKEIPQDKLNSHFANVSHTIITNNKSRLNELSYLKRFFKLTMSISTSAIPPNAVYEV